MAQISYTYTKASIACASLTDEAIFIPEFQRTSACTKHQREDPMVVNMQDKLPPGENSFFSQSQKEDQRQEATCALCSRETGRNGVLTVYALPCGFSTEGAPAGEGCCWSMLASAPNNTPFMSLKHRLCPISAEESLASPYTSRPQLLPRQKAMEETVPRANWDRRAFPKITIVIPVTIMPLQKLISFENKDILMRQYQDSETFTLH